jgi:hypothetical protein
VALADDIGRVPYWPSSTPVWPQLTAAIYETGTGRELRVVFDLSNLVHSGL